MSSAAVSPWLPGKKRGTADAISPHTSDDLTQEF